MSIRRRYIHLGVALVLALVGALALNAAVAVAAPGDLDATFGTGGIAMMSLGSGLDKATAMAVQPDGKYVVAGIHTDGATFAQTATLVRIDSDGSLDATFGSNWGADVHWPSVAGTWEVSQILIDDLGRMYLFTNLGIDARVLRLLSDGQIDASFGVQGVVDVENLVGNTGSMLPRMALTPGGQLMLGGGTVDPIHQHDITVVRLLEDGSLDPSFGTAGMFRIDVANGTNDTFSGLTVAENGDIVVTGYVALLDVAVLRLSPSGVLSPAFGVGGLLVMPSWGAYQATFERSDGSLLLCFSDHLKRVSSTGVPDSSFGTGGTMTVQGAPVGGNEKVLMLSDGSFVRAGTINSGYPTYNDLLISRSLADGSVDAGFGTNGAVVTNLGGADDCAAAAIDPEGRLVVAGYAYPSGAASSDQWRGRRGHGVSSTFGMGLVRYLCGPSPIVPPPVTKPALTKLSSTFGKRGAAVTITGKGFGAKRTTSYVKFGSTRVAQYVSWSATRIKCKVPAKAKFGKLKVTVVTGAGTSNAKTFTVRH